MNMLHLLTWLILIVAVCPLIYYVLAIYCAWDYFRKAHKVPPPDRSFAPPVSILKPVRGLDSEAYENFASFCKLDYPEYEIVFATGSEDDPVVPTIRQLQKDFPKTDIRLIAGVPFIGMNRKVNNLCALEKAAKYELMVFSDSDVRVEPDYLRDATAPLADPEVGLVTAFFRGKTCGRLLSDMSAILVPSDSAAGALVARKLEGKMQFAFGWTMATTKQRVADFGGFEAIANHHSDDFEIGNRISLEGYRVEFMRKPVWMVFPKESLREFLLRELRWAIGLRNVRPMGNLGLALTFGLPWCVLAAMVAPSWTIAASYLIAYVVLRFALAWIVGVWGIGDPVTRRSLWLIPARGTITTMVWIAAFFSNTIRWRGSMFRVKEGLLIPVADTKIK